MGASSGIEVADVAPAVAKRRSRRHLVDLILHLVRRELSSAHRNTLLGWAWPLARQLAQLAVLVFLFSKVLDLGIDDYPVFVFTGLIAWSWFQTAVSAAAASVVTNAHLVGQPRFPSLALPLVAVAVPCFDVLMALPVLLVLLATEGRLDAATLLLPLPLMAQFAFTAGVALIVSATNVYFRDVQNLVGVLLLMLFYLTPVFYGLRNVPSEFHWLLRINPLTAFVNADRALLFYGRLPELVDVVIGSAAAMVALVVGIALFRRLQPGFVDEL